MVTVGNIIAVLTLIGLYLWFDYWNGSRLIKKGYLQALEDVDDEVMDDFMDNRNIDGTCMVAVTETLARLRMEAKR